MGKLLLILVAALAAVVAAAAAGKTVTVTITKAGYVPNAVTVDQGDTVQFTNTDTVAHQVTFKSTAGVTCTPNPLVLQPTASGSCTFQEAGNYSYSDPNVKGNTFRGTITVKAVPATLSIAAKPTIVIYGGHVTLSGTLSTQQTNQTVDVLAQQCGAANSSKSTTVQTGTAGAWTASVQPLANTAYSAKTKAATSVAVTVRVRPRMTLTRVAAHRYSLRVTASTSFAGKFASFQRWNATTSRWVPVKTVALRASSAGVAPSVISTASFRSTVASGLRVRATLGQAQVGSCYASGLSNTIRS